MSGPVLVLGLEHEPPVAAALRALTRLGAPHLLVDQRRLVAGAWRTWLDDRGAGGVLTLDGLDLHLDIVGGVYTRLTSWAELPGITAEMVDQVNQMHAAIDAWLETTPARVVNRTSANDSNNSKPYQSLIIRDYFEIPATVVTNDPAAVTAFRAEHGRIIYKSASGERSIVTAFTDADLERLPLLASCPVQFQEHVEGLDVRVHVVGEEVFATAVTSEATDYRYDTQGDTRMEATALPDHVAEACVALTARLGLELSGIDLRFAADGRIVCFEVNPSPAYIVYEDATGQPIADALARLLMT